MDIYTFLILAFAFPYIAIATPLSEWQKNGGLGNFKTANITGNSTADDYRGILANLTFPGDGKDIYDDIREYNRRHPENQIADVSSNSQIPYIVSSPWKIPSLIFRTCATLSFDTYHPQDTSLSPKSPYSKNIITNSYLFRYHSCTSAHTRSS